MDKKRIIIFVIMLAAIAVVAWGTGRRAPEGSVPDEPTNGATGAKNYVRYGADECSRVQITCVGGYERFDDEAGCGCRERE